MPLSFVLLKQDIWHIHGYHISMISSKTHTSVHSDRLYLFRFLNFVFASLIGYTSSEKAEGNFKQEGKDVGWDKARIWSVNWGCHEADGGEWRI